ncbi:MAG: pilus assembly protein [Bdellovibrionales bacterium]|nr:pilus assembly protein [Bdellovibrionales bacterium]
MLHKCRKEGGATIVEFAQVLPFLLLFMAMFFDVGRFMAKNAILDMIMAQSVRHGASQVDKTRCAYEARQKFTDLKNLYWFARELNIYDVESRVLLHGYGGPNPLPPEERWTVLSLSIDVDFDCLLCSLIPGNDRFGYEKMVFYPTEHCDDPNQDTF